MSIIDTIARIDKDQLANQIGAFKIAMNNPDLRHLDRALLEELLGFLTELHSELEQIDR